MSGRWRCAVCALADGAVDDALALGVTATAVADELGLSGPQVRRHREHLYRRALALPHDQALAVLDEHRRVLEYVWLVAAGAVEALPTFAPMHRVMRRVVEHHGGRRTLPRLAAAAVALKNVRAEVEAAEAARVAAANARHAAGLAAREAARAAARPVWLDAACPRVDAWAWVRS